MSVVTHTLVEVPPVRSRASQRGERSVSLPLVVLAEPFASWATAVAVAFRVRFLRSAFSFAFESFTVTRAVFPGAILKAAAFLSSLSVPAHAPAVAAGQASFTFATPFFDTLTVCFLIVTPANGGGGGAGTVTRAVAVVARPVESVTVTVAEWVPGLVKVCCTVAVDAVAPSSKAQANDRASPSGSHEPEASK